MKAFYEMTKRFSAEGDIRIFIEKYPKKTLTVLHKWTQDSNCHVRRLVSEGTRPRLPLCSRLPQFQKDPAPVLELLEKNIDYIIVSNDSYIKIQKIINRSHIIDSLTIKKISFNEKFVTLKIERANS